MPGVSIAFAGDLSDHRHNKDDGLEYGHRDENGIENCFLFWFHFSLALPSIAAFQDVGAADVADDEEEGEVIAVVLDRVEPILFIVKAEQNVGYMIKLVPKRQRPIEARIVVIHSLRYSPYFQR